MLLEDEKRTSTNLKKSNWITKMAKKRKDAKNLIKKETSDEAFHNNLIDQILNNIKTKEGYSMLNKQGSRRRSISKKLERKGSKNISFSNFYDFSKKELKKLSLEKKNGQITSDLLKENNSIFTIQNHKIPQLVKLNSQILRKSKHKLRTIFNVISCCHYIINYQLKFGMNPKLQEKIIQDKNEKHFSLLRKETKEQELERMSFIQEEIQMENFPFYIINPYEWFASFWNRVIFILYFYLALIGSSRICFTENYLNTSIKSLFIFDLIVECILFLDIVLNFFTAFIKNDVLIIESSKIAKKYVKSWFIFDLICILPYNIYDWIYIQSKRLIILDFNKTKNMQMEVLLSVKFCQIVKLIRVIKFYNLLNNLQLIERFSEVSLKIKCNSIS